MTIVRIVWMLTLGIPLALLIYTLALLCAVTIIGIPLAGVLVIIGNRVLTLSL